MSINMTHDGEHTVKTSPEENSTKRNKPMHELFTGYFNGFNVEVRLEAEKTALYDMGCFGKGATSRSSHDSISTSKILRRRQYLMRNTWYYKFTNKEENIHSHKEVPEHERNTATNKDLLSNKASNNDLVCMDNHNIVVVIPDSDSDNEDYFKNLKPKCCENKIKIDQHLFLGLQEAYYLVKELKCLRILDDGDKLLNTEQCWDLFQENDQNFLEKYVVYNYFKCQGFVIKSGIKFGGDYLLYNGKPSSVHAKYIVLIKYKHERYKMNWMDVLAHVRTATTTAKELLLAEVIIDDSITTNNPLDLSKYSVLEVLVKKEYPLPNKESTD